MNTLLKGVKVLDLTSFVAGPTSTQLMAYMGANVVKVEMPVCGDSGRGMMNMKIGHHSGNILQTNHGRKSIELDIQDSEGREVFKRLVKDYDIVLEGFRPGLMAKYGLDYENLKAVNPKLIYCSISTYGQTGPYSKRPGFDLIAQAESGIINSTGDPDGAPQRIGTYLGDYVGAQSVLSAICAALYHREVTGEGQYLDVSLYESLAYLSANVDVYSLFGLKNGRTGNHMFNSAPYGLFEGAGKRYIAICAPTPPIWKNLCIAMQREDLLENERYSDMSKRIENRYELVDIIQAWLSKYENASEAIEILRSHDVPCAEVKADWEMHECPQLASRHYFEDIPFPKSIVEETGRKQYKIKGLPFKHRAMRKIPIIFLCPRSVSITMMFTELLQQRKRSMRCLIAGTISSTSIDKRNIGKIVNAIKSLRPKAGGSACLKRSPQGGLFLVKQGEIWYNKYG